MLLAAVCLLNVLQLDTLPHTNIMNSCLYSYITTSIVVKPLKSKEDCHKEVISLSERMPFLTFLAVLQQVHTISV